MELFEEYLSKRKSPEHRIRMEEVLSWIAEQYPELKPRVAWNQPMFTDHGTFIIAFSEAKHHMSVAPERAGIERFSDEIMEAGYEHSKEQLRIPWNQPVPYRLLEKIIEFNISDKAGCSSFWRK